MASIPAELPADVARTHRKATPTGPAGHIDPVAPVIGPALSPVQSREVGAQAQYASRSVGKVFFRLPNDNTLWNCSASSIGSAKRRLVLTAGHCVHSGGRDGAWATEFVFVPFYYKGVRPHGTFVATYLTSKDPWIESRSRYYDMGIAVTANNEFGRRVVDEVGGNGLLWNDSREVDVVAQGYPVNLDGGEQAKLCEGHTERVAFNDWRPAFPCNFGHGASGGPWLQEYEDSFDSWGLGYANGVTTTATCLAVLAGCGAAGPADRPCSLVGVPSGVSLRVDEDLAAAATARLSVCEGTNCQERQVTLTQSTAPVTSSCSGNDCGAALEATGGKSGFAELPLSAGPVKVTVRLFDANAAAVLEGTAEATAKASTAPCGGEGRQISLTVSRSGVTG